MSGEEKKSEKNTKKQIPLRLSSSLYAELMQWAEDDFRSVNGQIEYLLTECVKYRKKHGKDDKDGDGNG
ncbi:MAG: hypothetical protein HDT43_13375 [Ruminococcaceae bacterium]|nr:hypothetical protein [Oscillospiraceae bacterium]